MANSTTPSNFNIREQNISSCSDIFLEKWSHLDQYLDVNLKG